MKKLLLIMITFICILTGCNKYKDKEVKSLVFEDGNGFTSKWEEKIFDFVENSFSIKTKTNIGYNEFDETLELICNFSEEEGKTFMKDLSKNGLFSLKKKYEPFFPIMDGSSWFLTVTFSDDTTFYSEGYMKNPSQAKKINKVVKEFVDYEFFYI